MMLKANGELLDFNGDVEIERKAKLFEEIETIDGDFSYQFEITLTSHNARVLGLPYADNISKQVYQRIESEVISDNGDSIAIGFLRIENIENNIAYCSFFSGNSNWFSMLSGNMSDLDLSEFEMDQDVSTIQASWNNDEGVVFPLMDIGAMSVRPYRIWKIEDFAPGIYVKTLLKKVFQSSGLKVQGELLSDPLYNKIVVFANNISKNQIDARTSFVENNTGISWVSGTFSYQILFDVENSYPYFDGSQNNFDITTSRYTADVKMNVRVDASVIGFSGGPALVFASTPSGLFYILNTDAPTGSVNIQLEAGEILQLVVFTSPLIPTNFNRATMKVTPIYVFAVFSDSIVPKWTKQQFVSNVLRLFCCVTKYDHYSKTITINLFDKIKHKTPIDISPYITITGTDYTDFISNYGKTNKFTYQEGEEIEDLRSYNISTFLKYGAGEILSDNEFIDDTADILESEFSNPLSYINRSTGASLERINFVEMESNGDSDITSVDDDGGLARVYVSDIQKFTVGTIVRIESSNVPQYNGDWYIFNIASDYFNAYGLTYVDDATGRASSMIHKFTDADDVYLMVNVPSYDVIDFSNNSNIYLEENSIENCSISYFNMLNIGKPINDEYKQGLSFGGVTDPLSYQRTLIDTFWQSFSSILNDPVKLKFVANIPKHIHDQMDFLSPIEINTLESVNRYYLNLESGYMGSHIQCSGELIKLP